MRNFEEELEKASEKKLLSWVNTRDPHFTVLASNELIRRVINKLQLTVEIFNKESSRQTEKMIRLTIWIVGLTIIMAIGLILQVFLSFYFF